MSETFSVFVPSSGSGPDASVGEPRLLEASNCRLEAEGRVVTTPGFEEVTIPGTTSRATAIEQAGNGLLIETVRGSGDSVFGATMNVVDQGSGALLEKASSLLPLSLDILATESDAFYSCRMGYAAGDNGALICYSMFSSASVLYWIKLSADGIEESRGTVSVPGTNPGGTLRFFCLGEGLVFATKLLNNSGTYESDEYIFEYSSAGSTPALVQRFVRSATAPSNPGSIGYAYTIGGTVVYRGTQAPSPYNLTVSVSTSTWTATTSAALACGSTNYHSFSPPFFRSNNGTLTYFDTATTPWSVVINGVARAYLGTASADWIANGIYPCPSVTKGAWVPGPLFMQEDGGSITKNTIPVLWCRAAATLAENEAGWDAPYRQQIAYRQFCGPFLDLGASDGCIVFSGTPIEAPAVFTGNKGVWAIEPAGGAIGNASSSLKLLGEHSLDRLSGYALLLYDSSDAPLEFTLVVLGTKTLENATVSLAVQRWKLTSPDKRSPGLLRSSPKKDGDSEIIPGSVPLRISGNAYDEARLRWIPKMPPRFGGPLTGTATVLACYCFVGYDSEGRYIRGPLSPVSSTANFPAAGGGVQAWFMQAPPVTNKITGMRVELYRTIGNGTTFYLAAVPAVGAAQLFDGGSGYSYVYDSATDSTLPTGALLYTQSAAGALSGRYETASIPPCRLFHRGVTRSIAGGLERSTCVQFSDRYVNGEITPWPTGNQWIVDVGYEVLGVGESDAGFLVFTDDGIFSISGYGPDAMGDGSFDDPRRVSSVAVFSAASIIETPLGWMFQGKDRQIYLLRSGGSAPDCVSLSDRSRVSGGDDRSWFDPDSVVVSSVFIPAENSVYFAVQNQSDASHNRTLVVDLRTLQISEETVTASGTAIAPLWSHDERIHCKTWVDDDLVEDGIVVARKRSRSDADWWLGVRETSTDPEGTAHRKASFSTSNLTPWGKTGWGRVREVSLSVDRDSESEASEEPNIATITLENDNDTETFNYLDADLLDNVVSLVPANQKCSELKLTVVDNSTPPMIWTGVNLSTTSAGRTRVR